ncbi:DUF2683 family protein [Dyadobacter psychrotolerans]|uniref:Uncharacterized protein n=1 Tax=Dyadobacter psychrotolerans TaxID=2541721 RepID=A0A4R5DGZ5_9BACT|nr:DUF2683 family protein [Dyadobacter psychrotolerans]TDE10005.1 hypothetical protein E0F88_29195 [Dyadobacter psychrotolerans]
MTTLTINTEDKEVLNAVKALLKGFKVSFKEKQDAPYNPEFVAKIEKSRQEVREGKTVKIELDEIGK